MALPNLDQITTVILDMDGLMFNTEDIYGKACEELGKRRGKKFTNNIHQEMMGRAALEDIQVMLDAWGLQEDAKLVFQERRELYLSYVDEMIKKEVGLDDLLHKIETSGRAMAIVTGSAKEIALKNLSIFNLQNRFRTIITGDMVTKGKPDPEIYILALKQLGKTKDECLIIEDAVNGVLAGKAAGCVAFAVPNKYNHDQDFSAADAVFENLFQIAEILP